MGLKGMMGTLKEKAAGLEDLAEEKVNEWLDEYKKATAVLATFGFTVDKFTVGLGLPPEIHTSFSGSIEKVHPENLKKMIEEHQGESLLIGLLKALILARRCWERVELKVTAVTLNVTLGVPPAIAVDIH